MTFTNAQRLNTVFASANDTTLNHVVHNGIVPDFIYHLKHAFDVLPGTFILTFCNETKTRNSAIGVLHVGYRSVSHRPPLNRTAFSVPYICLQTRVSKFKRVKVSQHKKADVVYRCENRTPQFSFIYVIRPVRRHNFTEWNFTEKNETMSPYSIKPYGRH